MTRQFWIYLAPDDEAPFLQAIDAVDPGILVVPGRHLRGDASGLLARGIDGIEFPSLSQREARRYVFHRRHSNALALFPVTEGPLAGANWLDETRSDCLLLVRPGINDNRLEPARLVAHLVRVSARERQKHAPGFIAWANRVLRDLPRRFPGTSVDFIRIAPAALAFARAGGEITYLHQRIGLEPR